MKNFFFVFFVLVGILFSSSTFAAPPDKISWGECSNRGGVCSDSGENGETCANGSTQYGICDGWTDDEACCAPTVLPIDPDKRRIVDCSKIGGQCKAYSTVGTADACDNEGNTNEGGTEDYVGYCHTAIGGASENRQDCCVPNNSVTAEQADARDVLQGQWVRESVCEAPVAEGGYAGDCRYAASGWDPTDLLTGSNVCGDDFPEYVGTCGTFGANAVCCTTRQVVSDVTGTAQPNDIEYGDYQLLEQIPGSSNTSGRLQPYLESLYKAGFVLIVIGAVFMIGLGGFIYMSSAGNTYLTKKGKGLITDALIGLIVALFIWLILNIINPDLVKLQIDPLPGISFDPYQSGANTAASNDVPATGNNCAEIPASDLVTIDGYQMLKSVGENFTAMKAAARADGHNLQLRSGYRSPARQLEIWNQFGCRLQGGRAVCPGGKLVAIPCSLGGRGTNHSSGHAIDIHVGCANGNASCNTPIYNWLKANGARFNFKNAIPQDPVHWSATGK